MSVVTRRYSRGNPETDIDYDIRQIAEAGLVKYCDAVLASELNDNFWTAIVPMELDTSSTNSPLFLSYMAAQVKANDKGFLSRDIAVQDLLLNRGDVHHIYPKNLLKKQGLSRGRYNQVANFVLAQSEINIAIGDRAPEKYFRELGEQCRGGVERYGAIVKVGEMRSNLAAHAVPDELIDGVTMSYDEFLDRRRSLMARKIRAWFESL